MIGLLPQPTAPAVSTSDWPLLEVDRLSTEICTERGVIPAVQDVSFSIRRGQTLALVGETGAGKSMAALSLLRLLPSPSRIAGGSLLLRSKKVGDVDLARLKPNADVLYRIRGGVVGFISQEPLSALSPVHTVGNQISEMLRIHVRASAAETKRRSLEMLAKVGFATPERAYGQYPHELSGGMRQRALIAMALICEPELVIADEPTTALDVTTQSQVLGLLKSLQHEIGCAVLLITHDMSVVARMADDVAVMYYGRVVEKGSAQRVLARPLHPYTRGLLQSLPAMNTGDRLYTIPGSAPSLFTRPSGCPFHPRCAHRRAGICDVGDSPSLREAPGGGQVACGCFEELG